MPRPVALVGAARGGDAHVLPPLVRGELVQHGFGAVDEPDILASDRKRRRCVVVAREMAERVEFGRPESVVEIKDHEPRQLRIRCQHRRCDGGWVKRRDATRLEDADAEDSEEERRHESAGSWVQRGTSVAISEVDVRSQLLVPASSQHTCDCARRRTTAPPRWTLSSTHAAGDLAAVTTSLASGTPAHSQRDATALRR